MSALHHYASKPVTLERRVHEQDMGMKPSGLWVSVGTEWLDWCRSEDFRTTDSMFAHVATVAATANIVTLASPGDLDTFTRRYGQRPSPKWDTYYIDWAQVADEYDGILITPYQWSRRNEMLWYYGWDVASGCIWNPAVVSLGAAVEVSFEGAES